MPLKRPFSKLGFKRGNPCETSDLSKASQASRQKNKRLKAASTETRPKASARTLYARHGYFGTKLNYLSSLKTTFTDKE